MPSSPPPSPNLTVRQAPPRPQDTFSSYGVTTDDDICIYAAQSPEELSSSSRDGVSGATASSAPRQSSNTEGIVIHPQLTARSASVVLPSPRFWVALTLSIAAVGWAGWRLLDDTRPHDTENQVATSVLAFVFALWLPTPS